MRPLFKYAAIPIALLALATGASAQTHTVQLDVITNFESTRPDGSGQPNHAVQGPDGAFYAASTFSSTSTVAFFRIDAAARTHSVVATLDTGQGFPSVSRLVLASDGSFYASFSADPGGGIISFNPATNAVAVIREFTLGSVDGSGPGALTLGRDGRFYGVMTSSGPDGAGSLFTYHPWTGSFETIHQFSLNVDSLPAADGAYPVEALVEGAVNGVFYGVNNDATFCGNAFKFDTTTSTLTSLHTFDAAAEGCFPSALAVLPNGHLIGVTTAYGGTLAESGIFNPALGGVFTLDPVTGAVTPLHMFLEADGFSPMLPGNVTLTPDGRVYVLATDIINSVARILRVNPETRAVQTIQDVLAGTPQIGALTVGSDARLYGIYNSSQMFALGVLDPIMVQPAGGDFHGTTTLSATLHALGMPLAGRTIAFTLNGVAVGSAVTNPLGVATLDNVSLVGVAVGTFPNAIGASSAEDLARGFRATTGTGLLNVTAVITPGLMIGHGHIAANQLRYEFKFVVQERPDGTDRGKLDLRIRDLDDRKKKAVRRDDRFVSTSYTDVFFDFDHAAHPNFDTVTFAGTGTWNGVAGYRFEAFAEDRVGHGGGKHRETFRIVIYSSTNQVVASAQGIVRGGLVASKRLRK